jgi:hypothetical protein
MKTMYLLSFLILMICFNLQSLSINQGNEEKVINKKCSILHIYTDNNKACQIKTYLNYKSKPIVKVIFYYKSNQDINPFAFKVFYQNDYSFFESKVIGYDISATSEKKQKGFLEDTFPGEVKFIHKVSKLANPFIDED